MNMDSREYRQQDTTWRLMSQWLQLFTHWRSRCLFCVLDKCWTLLQLSITTQKPSSIFCLSGAKTWVFEGQKDPWEIAKHPFFSLKLLNSLPTLSFPSLSLSLSLPPSIHKCYCYICYTHFRIISGSMGINSREEDIKSINTIMRIDSDNWAI